jgi:hypothetical protein
VSAHARIGPSSLARVRLCPGSVAATDGLPRRSNEAAAQGTLLHDIAADCLDHGLEPEDFIGRTYAVEGFGFVLGQEPDETDPTCMVECLEWIRQQPGELFVERRLTLDPYMPGQFGTMDLGILDWPADLATVLDWKFGAGVLVATRNNEQILGYAISFATWLIATYGRAPSRWRLMIEQPRAPGGARYFEPWEITLDELMAFGRVLEQIWAAANDPDAPRVAGPKQCHFCDAKDTGEGCAAYNSYMLDLASLKFSDLDSEAEPDLPAGERITPARRSYIVRHAPMIRSWLEDLHANTLADALNDRPTPGLKAVDGRAGNRVYLDPPAAEAIIDRRFA